MQITAEEEEEKKKIAMRKCSRRKLFFGANQITRKVETKRVVDLRK